MGSPPKFQNQSFRDTPIIGNPALEQPRRYSNRLAGLLPEYGQLPAPTRRRAAQEGISTTNVASTAFTAPARKVTIEEARDDKNQILANLPSGSGSGSFRMPSLGANASDSALVPPSASDTQSVQLRYVVGPTRRFMPSSRASGIRHQPVTPQSSAPAQAPHLQFQPITGKSWLALSTEQLPAYSQKEEPSLFAESLKQLQEAPGKALIRVALGQTNWNQFTGVLARLDAGTIAALIKGAQHVCTEHPDLELAMEQITDELFTAALQRNALASGDITVAQLQPRLDKAAHDLNDLYNRTLFASAFHHEPPQPAVLAHICKLIRQHGGESDLATLSHAIDGLLDSTNGTVGQLGELDPRNIVRAALQGEIAISLSTVKDAFNTLIDQNGRFHNSRDAAQLATNIVYNISQHASLNEHQKGTFFIEAIQPAIESNNLQVCNLIMQQLENQPSLGFNYYPPEVRAQQRELEAQGLMNEDLYSHTSDEVNSLMRASDTLQDLIGNQESYQLTPQEREMAQNLVMRIGTLLAKARNSLL